jgi:glycosyltransferase involved in cell wall biosynthesis
MSLVTVIIPTWNRPEGLRRCLTSIQAQTFKDYDVVVLDDHSASEEKYAAVIKRFSEKMPLQYVRLPLNRGSQYCRNKGLSLATGRYVAFLDDDDEWQPAKLERQVAVFESGPPELGLVYTWADACDEDGRIVYRHRESQRGHQLHPLLDHCFMGLPSVMCRTAAAREVGGFDEDYPSCQDWDMWTRLVEGGYRYDVVEEVLAIYHLHQGPSIGKALGAEAGYKIYFDKHTRSYLKCGMHKNLSENYRGFGWSLYAKGELSSAAKVLKTSIRLWKFNAKAWCRLAQTYGAGAARKLRRKGSKPVENSGSGVAVGNLAFEGLRFQRQVISELRVGGENIIEPWGVEFADSNSFFSLESGIGYRYVVLEKDEKMSDTSRQISQVVRMQEGLVRVDLTEYLESETSLRRMLRMTCLKKTNLVDFVLRFRFKHTSFPRGLIDGKVYEFTNSWVYHQFPVDCVEVGNSHYRIRVSIIDSLVPGNMSSFMYLKDADRSWVIHARMLPRYGDKEVIRLCSTLFKNTPLPQPITDLLLKSDRIKRALYYRGERCPYRNKFVSLFSPNAYPIAAMEQGTELSWDVRCQILPSNHIH